MAGGWNFIFLVSDRRNSLCQAIIYILIDFPFEFISFDTQKGLAEKCNTQSSDDCLCRCGTQSDTKSSPDMHLFGPTKRRITRNSANVASSLPGRNTNECSTARMICNMSRVFQPKGRAVLFSTVLTEPSVLRVRGYEAHGVSLHAQHPRTSDQF